MAEAARVLFEQPIRKPPGSEGQYNLITGGVDVVPEQLELPLPPVDDTVLPEDGSVILLATENGSQLFVSGFGLFIGKKSERVVVKQGKSVCARFHSCACKRSSSLREGSAFRRISLRNCANAESGSHF